MPATEPVSFSEAERESLYRVMRARRDMRHFRPNSTVDEAVLLRILSAAHMAPSVGLMQPWRFIRITDSALRERIHALVDAERHLTAAALGARDAEFMRLKVEGIRDCAELMVAALMDRREEHIFGRRTLPEMDLASVACAIQNLWLASRAEGLGMGWVSLFDPEKLAAQLNIPEGGKPVAILCLGQVDEFYPAPMLQMEGWRKPQMLDEMLFENSWGCKTLLPPGEGKG